MPKSKHFIINQGSFVLQKVEQLPDAEVVSLVKDVTKLYVETISGNSQVFAERDAMNESADELPPVLPHVLATLEPSDLCAIVRRHRERLLALWSTTEIDAIEQQHQELVAQEKISWRRKGKKLIQPWDRKYVIK